MKWLAAIAALVAFAGCGSDGGHNSPPKHEDTREDIPFPQRLTAVCPPSNTPAGGVQQLVTEEDDGGYTKAWIILCKDGTIHKVKDPGFYG